MVQDLTLHVDMGVSACGVVVRAKVGSIGAFESLSSRYYYEEECYKRQLVLFANS